MVGVLVVGEFPGKIKTDNMELKRTDKRIEGHIYYYIGARNAWDTVPIGLFFSKEEALRHKPCTSKDEIVRPATEQQVNDFFRA